MFSFRSMFSGTYCMVVTREDVVHWAISNLSFLREKFALEFKAVKKFFEASEWANKFESFNVSNFKGTFSLVNFLLKTCKKSLWAEALDGNFNFKDKILGKTFALFRKQMTNFR
mmetsp:Transcript_5818/g.8733  ORF Transcript_5818/g.8733 Transcript_5818/m.8733 type:complete len:114 (-) Transcript_5818:28-369(-)